MFVSDFLFQAEDGIRDLVRSRGLGDVYKRQALDVVLDARHAESGQQRWHQHDGTAHLLGQVVALRVELRLAVMQVQHAGGVVLSLIHISEPTRPY